uniref:C-type lectin domain-containing protein n=1 Tax=Tetraodon nigroviridis TaxID=99883 RepID=H3BZF8_TETNG
MTLVFHLFKAKPCPKCPDGWQEFEGQCYYFSDNKLKWEEARERCQQQGADLVQVSSKEEQQFLTDRVKPMMSDNDDLFWIGLTDSVTEDTWLWVNGSSLDERLKFWAIDEPNNYLDGEDCVRMGNTGGNINSWSDRACGHSEKSICEKP